MIKKSTTKRKLSAPVVLLILDGWGMASKNKGNAIELARKPVFDLLWRTGAHTKLAAAGRDAGLPSGQAGNSEAGHMNIGAGRVVDQDSVQISKSISTGQFFKNPAFEAAARHVRKNKSHLHLMGLLANDQSAHADPDHLWALIAWARQKKFDSVFLHLFTDGRDSPPHSALKLVEALMRGLKNQENKKTGQRSGEWIATIMGRHYGMDRKKDWANTKLAYEAMVLGKGLTAKSPQQAITQSYNRQQTDEFVPPYVIKRGGKPIAKISDNDAVIFFNLRSDRARQLAKPFVQAKFNQENPKSFKRSRFIKNLLFVAMTDFGPDLDSILTAYPAIDLPGTLPMVLGSYRQLYVAEAEKYAHITYFFNGGYADPVAGEDRVMVASPHTESYDKTPGMAVEAVTEAVLRKLSDYDFIGINFSIPDMTAHTGNIAATIKSVEIVDAQLAKLKAAIIERGGILVITADHGNADKMLDLQTGEMYTEHTTAPVPFIIFDPKSKPRRLHPDGRLADVAPTILKLINIKPDKHMTGKALF